jgi:hypothetical protein
MLDAIGILRIRRHRLDFDYIRNWCTQLEITETLEAAQLRAQAR